MWPTAAPSSEQTWPSGAGRAGRGQAAPPAPPQPRPAPAGDALRPRLAPARRALDGTRVDLDPARDAVTAAIEAAADLQPRKLQDLGHEIEALSGLVEAWLEQRADYDDARAATRALRRGEWDDAPGGGQVLPQLPGAPADAAEDARDLAAAASTPRTP